MSTKMSPIDSVKLEIGALSKRIDGLEHELLAKADSAKYQICYQVKGDSGCHDLWVTSTSPVAALKAFAEWQAGISNVSIHKQVICGTGGSLHKMEEQL